MKLLRFHLHSDATVTGTISSALRDINAAVPTSASRGRQSSSKETRREAGRQVLILGGDNYT